MLGKLCRMTGTSWHGRGGTTFTKLRKQRRLAGTSWPGVRERTRGAKPEKEFLREVQRRRQ